MANGDAAAAAGMDVLDGTEDKRDGWDEINKTRDYIADKTDEIVPLSKGGTGATEAAGALANLQAAAAGHVHIANEVNGGTWDKVVNTAQPISTSSSLRADSSVRSVGARNQSLTTDYASLYADGAGLFGIPASSKYKKKDLDEWSDEDADRFVSLVHAYWGRYRGEDEDAPLRPFLILQEFEAAGFSAFVIYDIDGHGQGLHYELVVVGLLAVTRRQVARANDHEARLAALEAR